MILAFPHAALTRQEYVVNSSTYVMGSVDKISILSFSLFERLLLSVKKRMLPAPAKFYTSLLIYFTFFFILKNVLSSTLFSLLSYYDILYIIIGKNYALRLPLNAPENHL